MQLPSSPAVATVGTAQGHTTVRCLILLLFPLAHVTVRFSTHSVLSLYVLFFRQYRPADTMRSTVSSNCLQSPHLLSVSVRNIFVAGYFVCNALSCAGIVSLPVPAFRSPLDKHKILLVAVCQTFSTVHTAPYNFPYFFQCPSNSLFLGNFGLGGSDYEFYY